MKVSKEELEKWVKGIHIEKNNEKDDISELYGLDKDDCLDRSYPGVVGEDKDEEIDK